MDQQWIVTKVDGKVASVGKDYRGAARVLEALVKLPKTSVDEVVTCKMDTDALFSLSASLQWEDLRLFGSPFLHYRFFSDCRLFLLCSFFLFGSFSALLPCFFGFFFSGFLLLFLQTFGEFPGSVTRIAVG